MPHGCIEHHRLVTYLDFQNQSHYMYGAARDGTSLISNAIDVGDL
jgi:hypothetical protein